MKRKLTSLIVMALLATSAAGLDLIPVQAKGPTDQSAETMLGLLEQSHAEVTALFDSIMAAGGQVPEGAQEQLEEAVQLRAEAQAHYDAGEYEECIEKATDALNAYGKAASKVNEASKEDEGDDGAEDDEDEEVEKNLGLFTAVNRARAYLEKLRSIAADLESQGIDVTEAESLLDQAEATLNSAEEDLNQGDFDTAEGQLEEARSLMGQATGDLRSMSEPKKKEKMEHFVNQTMIRVRHLEEKMLRILSKYGVSEEDTQVLILEFQAMIAALEGVDVEREDLDDVVDQMKGLVKESHEFGKGFDEVEKETIERLNDVSKLEAKLNRYRERLRKLEQLGYNTGNMMGVYTEAEGLLSEVMVMLENGDREAAEELLDRLDELLDDIDDMMDEAEEEADDDKGRPGNSYEEKLADLQEKVADYAERIERLRTRGENTTSLEAKLEEIRKALEEAISTDDLEEIESMMDELDDLTDNGGDHGKGGKGSKDDGEESEVEPEEEPGQEGEGPSTG